MSSDLILYRTDVRLPVTSVLAAITLSADSVTKYSLTTDAEDIKALGEIEKHAKREGE